jgi:elongation factor P
MIAGSQLRAGLAIRYEQQPYKVLAADYHPGQGRMGGVNHVRLRNLFTGTLWEHSFRADLKLDELAVERQTLDFLYENGGQCCFMNPESYEQVDLPVEIVGEQAKFLEAGMSLPVEFIEGRAVSVVFPDIIEVSIADTAPPLHGQQDNAWKTARLANAVEIMVPPFVKTGDSIRLNLVEMKYMDRAKARAGLSS